MDHPELAVSNFMGSSFGTKGLTNNKYELSSTVSCLIVKLIWISGTPGFALDLIRANKVEHFNGFCYIRFIDDADPGTLCKSKEADLLIGV